MKKLHSFKLFAALVATLVISTLALSSCKQTNITPDEARAIGREAFIYGFPFVEGYKTLYKQAVDKGGRDFKAPFNQIGHARSVATPKDTWVVTPNSDTPYSFAWLDLCAEPVVITMPKIERERYYSSQLIDLQTFNFAYLGTQQLYPKGGKTMT